MVAADKERLLVDCLRDKKAIKRVFVMKRQAVQSVNVFGYYGKKP